MKTVYEIYFIKSSSEMDYFLKVGNFLSCLREKKINHFLISFDTKKIEYLVNINPHIQMDLSVWNRLKKISFPPLYRVLSFSHLSIPFLVKSYERGRKICERIGSGINILFLNSLFNLNDIKDELIELGLKKVVIFEENYPRFSKIKCGDNFIMIYNPLGKENIKCPYALVFKENIGKKEKEDKDEIYINTSPEEFFYLAERYFENSDNFIYKDEEKIKDFLALKKVENLVLKTEYLISYKAFEEFSDYSFLQKHIFEEFINFIEGKTSLKELKSILGSVSKKMGFLSSTSANLFNPFPFEMHYADRKSYIMRKIKPFEFLKGKEILKTLRMFKIRKRRNELIFLHRKEEEKEPLVLRREIRKSGRIMREISRETSFERGKYYRIIFEDFKFTKGGIKLKTVYSHFYPYVILEGSITGNDVELWFHIPTERKKMAMLSHRLKFSTQKDKDFAYLLYPFENLDFAIFSPFPFFFEKQDKTIAIRVKRGPFLIVIYPFPMDEGDIYKKFFPYIYSPMKISSKDFHEKIFFEIKEGIFILYSLNQVDQTKFILRGLCISERLKIYFPIPPGEAKLLDLGGEKEIGGLNIKNNEIKVEIGKNKILTLLLDFKTSIREIF